MCQQVKGSHRMHFGKSLFPASPNIRQEGWGNELVAAFPTLWWPEGCFPKTQKWYHACTWQKAGYSILWLVTSSTAGSSKPCSFQPHCLFSPLPVGNSTSSSKRPVSMGC